MSVRGIGTDIVAVARVAELMRRHGDRFLQRCFEAKEVEEIRLRQEAEQPAMIAGRWAAKEAFLKALGGKIAHIPYGDIAVGRQPGGAPVLEVSGAAKEGLSGCGGRRVHLSISHERDYAVATVLIED